MLLPNNPQLDVAALNAKLKTISAHRRRTTPLCSSQATPTATSASTDTPNLSATNLHTRSSSLRQFISRLPVIGTLATRLYQRTRRIAAPGLSWSQRLRLVPMIGSLAAWAHALGTLHIARQQLVGELRQLRYFEHASKQTLAELNARISHIESLQIEQWRKQFDSLHIATRLAQFDTINIAARLDQLDNLDLAARLAKFDTVNIAARLDRLDTFAAATATNDIGNSNRIAVITRELRRLTKENTAKSAPETSNMAAPTAVPAATVTANTDSFYIEFEDTFRGASDDIVQRLQVYLPYLSAFSGDASAHMVDVGCGRGEWLSLLQQHGFYGIGIDLNPVMVDTCHSHGLQAQYADAIAYLCQQPEGSLALVTGFHIIEHLPFEALLALFDAALRALRPDGLIIFETPNPENLRVGACNFYTDPTHRNPIVPDVARFIARQRGFARAELLRLHPYPESYLLAEDSELAKRFNTALYGPQDYAVLAWKTHAI